MLKKADAVPGTVIKFNDVLKDINGTIVPYVLFDGNHNFMLGDKNQHGIPPGTVAEIISKPKKIDGINAVQLKIGNSIGSCYWIDVYKNSKAISVGFKPVPKPSKDLPGPYYIRDKDTGELYVNNYHKSHAHTYENQAKNGTLVDFAKGVQILFVSKRGQAKKLASLARAKNRLRFIVGYYNDKEDAPPMLTCNSPISEIPDNWEIVRYDLDTKAFAEVYPAEF